MSIALQHLDAPVDGQKEHQFDDSYEAILLGRSREADVRFPPETDTIGGKDIRLIRTTSGNYELKRLGQYYLEIDGRTVPVDLNNIPIASGSVIRLGGRTGPSFRVKVTRQRKKGPVHTAMTRAFERVKPLTHQLPELRRISALVALAAVVGFGALTAYVLVKDREFAARIDAAEDRDEDLARAQFDQAELDALKAAVFLVTDESGKPIGTAWAVDGSRLATNAHVVAAVKPILKLGGKVLLKGNGIDDRQIVEAYSHPGYAAFEVFAEDLGKDSRTIFERISLASTYDVGILELAAGEPLPHALELASEEELLGLSAGEPIAYAGFPFERLQGADVASRDPEPQIKFGHVSSLTDVFMSRSLEPTQSLLVQHSAPATGGASGSPMINTEGEVVAILSGGNIDKIEGFRTPNAALINFAQRADLLRELLAGVDEAQNAVDYDKETYWQKRGAALNLDNYIDYELNVLRRDMRYRYKVEGNGAPITKSTDSLRSWTAGLLTRPAEQDAYTFEAKPGYLYAFIAQSTSGPNPRIGIDLRTGNEKLGELSEPGNVSGQFLDPAAWVTVNVPTKISVVVWGEVQGEARYRLYGLKWKLPPASAAAQP